MRAGEAEGVAVEKAEVGDCEEVDFWEEGG